MTYDGCTLFYQDVVRHVIKSKNNVATCQTKRIQVTDKVMIKIKKVMIQAGDDDWMDGIGGGGGGGGGGGQCLAGIVVEWAG